MMKSVGMVGICFGLVGLLGTGFHADAASIFGELSQQNISAIYNAYKGPPSNQMVIANPDLYNCLSKTKPQGQTVCKDSGNTKRLMHLFQGTNEITGSYRINGQKCTTGSTDCAYIVVAQYKIKCGANMTNGTCPFPESVTIDYGVKQLEVQPGTTPMATVETADNTNRAPSVIPYKEIRNLSYVQTSCKDLYPNDINMQYPIGVDSQGVTICGKDPNQDTIDAMQAKLCQIETAQVNSNGGITTTCNPPHSKIMLVNNGHSTLDCTQAGGTLLKLDGSPVAPSDLADLTKVNTLNHNLFCKKSGSSCGSMASSINWMQYQGWSTTVAQETDIYTRFRKHTLTNGCYFSWDNSCSAGSCPGTTARDGTKCNSGAHAWSNNGNIESNTCWNKVRTTVSGVCGDGVNDGTVGGCDCLSPVNSGTDGNWRRDVSAVRTEIGCY